MTTPTINAKTFPYRRKWTQLQVDEIMLRKDRLVEAMTDAVGPVGQVLYIDSAMLHILALHLALTGADVHDDLAYIAAVVHNSEGMPADFHEWVLKDEYKPPPPGQDETAAKARAAADQIRRQLPADVRRAVAEMMIAEYAAATDEGGNNDDSH